MSEEDSDDTIRYVMAEGTAEVLQHLRPHCRLLPLRHQLGAEGGAAERRKQGGPPMEEALQEVEVLGLLLHHPHPPQVPQAQQG